MKLTLRLTDKNLNNLVALQRLLSSLFQDVWEFINTKEKEKTEKPNDLHRKQVLSQ